MATESDYERSMRQHDLWYDCLKRKLNFGNNFYCPCCLLTLSVPHFLWLWQKWVHQSVQRHTSLTYPFKFFDIRTLWRPALSARMPECQKIKKGRLDQYGAEHLEV